MGRRETGSGGSDRKRMSSGGVFGLISGTEDLQWPVSVSVEWRQSSRCLTITMVVCVEI